MPDSNWTNRTLWTGDKLPILRPMNSESVDLIYVDLPFNSKRNYAAPIGSEAAEFKDTSGIPSSQAGDAIQWRASLRTSGSLLTL